MKKFNSTIFSLTAIAALSFGFSGCDGKSSNNNTYTTKTITGIVVDGYIKKSKVCLDINNNSLCDSNEPSTLTDDDGKWSFTYTDDDGVTSSTNIVAIYGTDIATNEAFSGIIQAPFDNQDDYIVLSPLTTLVSAETISNDSSDVENAATTIGGKLGLSISDIMADPIDLIVQDSNNTAPYAIALQVQQSLEAAMALEMSDGTDAVRASKFKAVLTEFKTKLVDSTETNATAVIKDVIDNLSITNTSMTGANRTSIKALIDNINTAFISPTITDTNSSTIISSLNSIQLIRHNEKKAIAPAKFALIETTVTAKNTSLQPPVTPPTDNNNSTPTNNNDSIPDTFSFTNLTNQLQYANQIESNTITISGIDTASNISILGDYGAYKIGTGSFTDANLTVSNGDTISVRLDMGDYNTTKSTTLTVGGVSATFSASTFVSKPVEITKYVPTAKAKPTTYTQSSLYTNDGNLNGITITALASGAEYKLKGDNFSLLRDFNTTVPYELNSSVTRIEVRYLSGSESNETVSSSITLDETVYDFNSTVTSTPTRTGYNSSIFYYTMKVFAQNHIFYLTRANNDDTLIALTPFGAMDFSFGTNGTHSFTSNEYTWDVNDLFTYGSDDLNNTFVSSGYNRQKILKIPDNGIGIGHFQSSSTDVTAQDFVVDALNNKLYAVELSNANGNITITKYNTTDGTKDSSYGTSGVVTLDTTADLSVASFNNHKDISSSSLDSSGNLYIYASAYVDNSNDLLIVAKIKSDGTLDTTFNTDGYYTKSGIYLDAADSIIDSNGKLYFYHETNTTTGTVTRLDTNGSIDTTYATNGLCTISPKPYEKNDVKFAKSGNFYFGLGNQGGLAKYDTSCVKTIINNENDNSSYTDDSTYGRTSDGSGFKAIDGSTSEIITIE